MAGDMLDQSREETEPGERSQAVTGTESSRHPLQRDQHAADRSESQHRTEQVQMTASPPTSGEVAVNARDGRQRKERYGKGCPPMHETGQGST